MMAVPAMLLALGLTWLIWQALNRTSLNIWVKTVLILVIAVVSVSAFSMLGIFLAFSTILQG